MDKPDKFTIRVYGILINDDKKVLLTNETIQGMAVCKFPGGGLEPGESLPQCVEREFMEETGIEVKTTSHFYTTDVFVQSKFDPSQQVIAIYYFVNASLPYTLMENSIHDFEGSANHIEAYWLNLSELCEETLTFQTDKIVARLLSQYRDKLKP